MITTNGELINMLSRMPRHLKVAIIVQDEKPAIRIKPIEVKVKTIEGENIISLQPSSK